MGTYLNQTNGKCEDCPIGTYQEVPAQEKCLKCPPGTSTTNSRTGDSSSCLGEWSFLNKLDETEKILFARSNVLFLENRAINDDVTIPRSVSHWLILDIIKLRYNQSDTTQLYKNLDTRKAIFI